MAFGQQGHQLERQPASRARLSMAGSAALILASLSPAELHLRGIAVGLSQPVQRNLAHAGRFRDERRGRVQASTDMWGPSGDPAWARNDPTVQVGKLVANYTRLWVYAGTELLGSRRGPTRPRSSLENMLHQSNVDFANDYQAAGGNNETSSTFPDKGTHDLLLGFGVLSCGGHQARLSSALGASSRSAVQ